jgi:light-regulated signal transduction histidine kinase (bacteriophytochrome)
MQTEELLYTPTISELLRSNKELEQFAVSASHDLQEPLKVMALYFQLFNRKFKGRLDAKEDEMLSSILEKADNMQKMVQNILNYSRVGAGCPRCVRLNPNTAFRKALENLKVSIAESSAHIAHDSLPIILGDEIQLTQLFQNLISNAIKFQKQGQTPSIYIAVRQKQDQWLFSIQDNGIGIEPSKVSTIFDMFKRLDTTGEYKGNGIGLGLCKRIVESHGGEIWAESIKNKGTTIHFTIPQIQQ